MRERAGVTARLIRVSRAFVAMAKDCKGITLLEAVERVSSIRSNFLSIFPRLSSILAEVCNRVLKSEYANSSWVSFGSSSLSAINSDLQTQAQDDMVYSLWYHCIFVLSLYDQ